MDGLGSRCEGEDVRRYIQKGNVEMGKRFYYAHEATFERKPTHIARTHRGRISVHHTFDSSHLHQTSSRV